MKLARAMKAAAAGVLIGGLLLTCACMLFVCPLIGETSFVEKSCHRMPGDDPEPAQCPYAVMQLVYSAPLADLTFGQDTDRADMPRLAAPEPPEPARADRFARAASPGEPPGTERHVRLCVFRI